jgi:uracil-DNA glycosylase family 4
MNNIYTDLSLYINSLNSQGNVLLYRNNDELSFLKKWISEKENVNSARNNLDPSLINDTLLDTIKNCIKCGNVQNKKYGFGNCENGIMILLNTPAGISNYEREKLKESSRELLNKMLGAIKIDLKKCYTTNLIKCEADNSFKRPGLMLKNCEPILFGEIAEFKPQIIIVMGDDIPIRKIINENKNISWHKINHPLTLIKNPDLKKSAWTILQKIEKIIPSTK